MYRVWVFFLKSDSKKFVRINKSGNNWLLRLYKSLGGAFLKLFAFFFIILFLSLFEIAFMGMIIGKHGKIARALRTVAKAAAKIADKKVTVEIK